MWLCQAPKWIKQILIVLTNNKMDDELMLEADSKIVPLLNDYNNYLYRLKQKNGTVKWFSNDYDNLATKFFVNFAVLKDFELKEKKWDIVERNTFGCGESLDRVQLCNWYKDNWLHLLKC